MKSNDRLALYESVLGAYLERGRDGAFVVVGVAGDSDQYVQYLLRGGRLHGEVGSRQWTEPERPLPQSAVAGLAALAFTGGGPERNFTRDTLPATACGLAELTDLVLRTAYDLDDDYCPVVEHLHVNDVTPPRAEPFTREMIAAHLRAHGVHYLRDEDGDFRVDLAEADGTRATVWFVAEGDGDSVYRVTCRVPDAPGTRAQALERCNTWNREHRWPKAFVMDLGESWFMVLSADLDMAPGITRSLFDSFTEYAVEGALDFCRRETVGNVCFTEDDLRPGHPGD